MFIYMYAISRFYFLMFLLFIVCISSYKYNKNNKDKLGYISLLLKLNYIL